MAHPKFRRPPMVRVPLWIMPAWDVLMGHPKHAEDHWVRRDRDFSPGLPTAPADLELVHRDVLHREAQRGPGRPRKLTPAEAHYYRRRYWEGDGSTLKLAEHAEISATAMFYLVHGYTYWYA